MNSSAQMSNARAKTADARRQIAASELGDFVARLFTAAGVPDDAARVVATGLVDADLEGLHSHGVMLVDLYIERIRQGSVSRDGRASVISDRQGAIVLDAGNALGQLTGRRAMDMAIDKAKEFAAGVVAVRHGFHFGTAGKYAQQAAAADCIGIAMCNTRPLMPAPGGAERVVGNNPIAVALPTDDEIPLILDMATSEAAMGKIRMAEKASELIPANWAVTAHGEPTTNPAEAVAGMLLPSGGAKGFGLALMIDLMCGLLSGGASGAEVRALYGDFAEPYDCSHLFIAIDIGRFGPSDDFRSRAAAAARRIRGARRAPDVPQLFTPGEPEWQRRQRANGVVMLDPSVADMLNRLATKLGVTATPFQQ
jgi:LDH2 family malate/lactate/ureidoglycolate dehydrogenase